MVPKNNPTPKTSLIRGLRSMRGISQTELSNQLGFSQSKISRLEQSKVSLKKGDADRIAQALGVDADLLSGGSDG